MSILHKNKYQDIPQTLNTTVQWRRQDLVCTGA